MAKKHWYWKFEPDKWLSDERLRSCSWAARGLWITMLSLMSKNIRVGYLSAGERPLTPELLARMVGGSVEEVEPLVQELRDAGVSETSEDGCIFSRKMVRDHDDYIRFRTEGKKGGNPSLKGGVNPPVNPSLTVTMNSLLGVTKLEEVQEKPTQQGGSARKVRPHPVLPDCLATAAFETAWHDWQRYRTELKKPLTPTGLASQLKKLEELGHDRAIECIRRTILKGWQGLVFDPEAVGGKFPFAAEASPVRARERSERRGEYPETNAAPLPRL